MISTATIRLSSEQNMKSFAREFLLGLPSSPLTIFLYGDLGTGKTTFVRFLAESLGIPGPVVSPTFALEQLYEAGTRPLLHLDLYRLTQSQAQSLVDASYSFEGIRCIEWAERLAVPHTPPFGAISLALSEGVLPTERMIQGCFHDYNLPNEAQIADWRLQLRLPGNVIAHCEVVGSIAERLAIFLGARGMPARPQALMVAGKLHDLFRPVDFRDGAGPADFSPSADDVRVWSHWRAAYPDQTHEQAGASFLRGEGYEALASLVACHGLHGGSEQRKSVEQQLLFYADKRVCGDRIVSVHDRFTDFTARYTHGMRTNRAQLWLQETLDIESKLFPDGPPF